MKQKTIAAITSRQCLNIITYIIPRTVVKETCQNVYEIEINIHSFGHSHTLKKGIKMVTEKQSMALSLNRNYGDDIPAARVHIQAKCNHNITKAYRVGSQNNLSLTDKLL